jgi:hypothetical protein
MQKRISKKLSASLRASSNDDNSSNSSSSSGRPSSPRRRRSSPSGSRRKLDGIQEEEEEEEEGVTSPPASRNRDSYLETDESHRNDNDEDDDDAAKVPKSTSRSKSLRRGSKSRDLLEAPAEEVDGVVRKNSRLGAFLPGANEIPTKESKIRSGGTFTPVRSQGFVPQDDDDDDEEQEMREEPNKSLSGVFINHKVINHAERDRKRCGS